MVNGFIGCKVTGAINKTTALSLVQGVGIGVLLTVFWLQAMASVSAQTAEKPHFLKSFYMVSDLPQNWSAWWQDVAEDIQLVDHLQVSLGQREVHFFLMNHLMHPDSFRSEGDAQWLIQTRMQKDTLIIEAVYKIGYFYCCGGAWMHAARLAHKDINGDGSPEILIRGRYEHGSDSHQLEGEAELIVFLNGQHRVPSPRPCSFPLPGFFPKSNMLLVMEEGMYKYFGMPRLDVAVVNRVVGRLEQIHSTQDSASGSPFVVEHTWWVPALQAEIQRWYENGDWNTFTQFEKGVHRQELFWDPARGGLNVTCPPVSHFFGLRSLSVRELVVQQGGRDVWHLYFDEPVLHIAMHPDLPLAVVFTGQDSLTDPPPHPEDMSAMYLVHLWAGQQIWVPIQELPEAHAFFSVWSPQGTYALFPDNVSDDMRLFRSVELLDEAGWIRDNWYENPDAYLSRYDLPQISPTVSAFHFVKWKGEARIICAAVGKTTTWYYEYDIQARTWRRAGKTKGK